MVCESNDYVLFFIWQLSNHHVPSISSACAFDLISIVSSLHVSVYGSVTKDKGALVGVEAEDLWYPKTSTLDGTESSNK